MEKRRIVVIEDEPTIAASVGARLEAEGFDVAIAGDGRLGVDLCRSLRPDLVILDLMLPGLDGLEVCRQIHRDRHVPVLMLTARDSDVDLEIGLAVGADDYLTKPFSPRELVARVRALLRRAERAIHDGDGPLRLGDLVIDTAARRVSRAGKTARLTPMEFDLLARLARTPGVVLERRLLLEQVWGQRIAAGERTVDSHVRSIRAKLGQDTIRTVHGVGYSLDPEALG
jgi:DNA-binding response OmpR family regulator